ASCEGEVMGGGLPAKLHRINGELINRKVASPQGRLHRLLAAGKSSDEVLTDFYLRALGRLPTLAERHYWRKQCALAGQAGRTEVLEDLVWGLLNCSEFNTNH